MTVFYPFNREILTSGKEDTLIDERETQVHNTPNNPQGQRFGCIRDENGSLFDRLLEISFYNTTRVAIPGGTFEGNAYKNSDAFIQRVDRETCSPARLVYSKYSAGHSGYTLSFCPHSDFINYFKRECGWIPHQYRLRASGMMNSQPGKESQDPVNDQQIGPTLP